MPNRRFETMESIRERFADSFAKIKEIKREMAKVIIGQEEAVNHLLICLFAGGHPLLKSVPGLAKSLMSDTLGYVIDVPFKRIQLTPDLLPSDIDGGEFPIFGTQEFFTRKGPIFSVIVLGDEINRTPPKTQSALMQAMQERKVTIGETTYDLDLLFTFIGTLNPIESEGTYSIAEAVLDRFMANVVLIYPSLSEEKRISVGTEDLSRVGLRKVCGSEDILPIRDYLLTADFINENHPVVDYVCRLIQTSRPECADYCLRNADAKYYKNYVELGISSRAPKTFLRALWVYSFGILGESMILPEHVKELAKSILRHRLILRDKATFEGLTSDHFIDWLLERVPVYA
jgi:MoxR-like ATPase